MLKFLFSEPKKIRLVDGPNNYTGRLEVYIQGPNQWGTICDDFWDETAAKVVCRQLGLTGGKPIKEAFFGTGSGPIWFDNVKCFGNESYIWGCGNRGIGTHNCNHTEDVGVKCDGKFTLSLYINKMQILFFFFLFKSLQGYLKKNSG